VNSKTEVLTMHSVAHKQL